MAENPPDEPKQYECKGLVNYHQTAEERRGKYWLAVSCGANNSWATRMRDWHLSKIERFFGLDQENINTPSLPRLQKHLAALVSPVLVQEPGTKR